MELPADSRLGNYRILRELGAGTMAVVYLAEDLRNGSDVALKVLPRAAASDFEILTRFRQEGRAGMRLRHPNVVGVMEAGEVGGRSFIAMEYWPSETAAERVKRAGPMDVGDALDVVWQIASGLDHAHAKGIYHRDVKPGNILIAPAGDAKLADLGLAKDLIQPELAYETQNGQTVGTPDYIAPEQARGDAQADGRADIYSLGGSLFFMLTGRPPYDGATPAAVMAKHLADPPPNLRKTRPNAPDAVVLMIRRMMAKKAESRYPDCASLMKELEFIAGAQAPAPQPDPKAQKKGWLGWLRGLGGLR